MGYAELIEKLQALPWKSRLRCVILSSFWRCKAASRGSCQWGIRTGTTGPTRPFTGFSMAQALRGMEDDPVTYTTDDLRERWQ